MASPVEVLPNEFDAEAEDRRQRVQAMRLRKLSVKAIAAILNAPVDVIAKDLQYLESQHSERYGPAPSVDPSQEIGWALADFEEMESVAWLEFHALKQEAQTRKMSPMFVARARQGWIRTAAMMRVLRLKLLGEHGYLLPNASVKAPSSVARADDIRNMLRKEGLLLEVAAAAEASERLLPIDEEFLGEETETDAIVDVPVDPIEQWLDDGGFFSGS